MRAVGTDEFTVGCFLRPDRHVGASPVATVEDFEQQGRLPDVPSWHPNQSDNGRPPTSFAMISSVVFQQADCGRWFGVAGCLLPVGFIVQRNVARNEAYPMRRKLPFADAFRARRRNWP